MLMTSVAERLGLWSLDEEVLGSIFGRANLGNEIALVLLTQAIH